MGGLARAKAHNKAQLRPWGKRGGRPVKLDRKGLTRLKRLLAAGKSQAECATILGVSVRTLGRAITRKWKGSRTSRSDDSIILLQSQSKTRHARDIGNRGGRLDG